MCRIWVISAAVLIDVEGHGREEVSRMWTDRTVGWFTSIYSVSRAGPWMYPRRWRGRALGARMKRIKEQCAPFRRRACITGCCVISTARRPPISRALRCRKLGPSNYRVGRLGTARVKHKAGDSVLVVLADGAEIEGVGSGDPALRFRI